MDDLAFLDPGTPTMDEVENVIFHKLIADIFTDEEQSDQPSSSQPDESHQDIELSQPDDSHQDIELSHQEIESHEIESSSHQGKMAVAPMYDLVTLPSSPFVATNTTMIMNCSSCLEIRKEIAAIKAMLKEITDNQRRGPLPRGHWTAALRF